MESLSSHIQHQAQALEEEARSIAPHLESKRLKVLVAGFIYELVRADVEASSQVEGLTQEA